MNYLKPTVNCPIVMRKTLVYCFVLTPLLAVLPLLHFWKPDFNQKLTPPPAADSSEIKADSTGKTTLPPPNDGKEYRIKKVVIDAGHGGHDSGCHGEDGEEKNNTLAIALLVGNKIHATYPSVQVIFTRDRDEFIELHRRAEIANRAKADLFMSIHCNSTDENSGAFGTETYVLGMHKKEENFEVARRENGAIFLENDYQKQYDGFDPNSNEAYIIFSLFQNAYLDKSILFAKYVEESLHQNAGRKSLGVKQAGFLVLRETAMPSVLIETGFLNHRREGAFLSSITGQETIADAVVLAFDKYKNAVETKEAEVKSVEKRLIGIPQPQKSVITEGVTFKIQLANSTKDMSQTARWQAVENLEVIHDGAVFKYFKIGFADYASAAASLKKLKASGFADAFIVAYRGGRRVNVEKP